MFSTYHKHNVYKVSFRGMYKNILYCIVLGNSFKYMIIFLLFLKQTVLEHNASIFLTARRDREERVKKEKDNTPSH